MGALEASRDTETGQDRRPPGRRPIREPWRVRGLGWPMAERGARAAMAGPRTQEALVGQGTREAMADQGAWVAMVDPRTQEALAGQGTREAMADRGAWVAMVDPRTQEAMVERGAWAASMAGSPPPNYLGETLPLSGVL